MMLVHDPPPSIPLPKAHREAKCEIVLFAVTLDIYAVPDGGREGHVASGRDLDVVEIERDRLCLRGEERLPCRHVSVQAARQERGRNIEHQYAGVMIGPNSR